MFYRLRRSIKYFKFNRQISRIWDTPPLVIQDGSPTIVTLVAGYDVQMYILAVKALYRRLGRGKIVSILDRDVTAKGRELIRRHLGDVEFVDIDSIDTGACPRGGTWERLVYIVRRSEREYVMQMDCDVLCVGPIPEVQECIEQKRAFTLADGIPKKPLADWANEQHRGDNIVFEFERRAPQYPDSPRLFYLRGSSGFAGFAPGAVTPQTLEDFHKKSEALLGARWKEWGTEQIASNFLVANSPNSVGLPKPKYLTWERHDLPEELSLLHFLGYCRFDRGVFPTFANREIDVLLTR